MSTFTERRADFIAHMERVVREPREWKFDMGFWLRGSTEFNCGTAACALGSYVGLSPLAKADGWRLYNHTDTIYRPVLSDSGDDIVNTLVYAARYFGATRKEMEELFLSSGYNKKVVTPKMVLERAKEIFKEYWNV